MLVRERILMLCAAEAVLPKHRLLLALRRELLIGGLAMSSRGNSVKVRELAVRWRVSKLVLKRTVINVLLLLWIDTLRQVLLSLLSTCTLRLSQRYCCRISLLALLPRRWLVLKSIQVSDVRDLSRAKRDGCVSHVHRLTLHKVINFVIYWLGA